MEGKQQGPGLEARGRIHHQVILSETSNDRPDCKPNQTKEIDWVSTIHICKTAEGKEERSRDQGKGTRRPDGRRLRYREVLDQGW